MLVVLDQFSRRLIGFAVQPVTVDGPALCRLFNQGIAGQGQCLRLSFDHDPLFQFHRWQANLRILGIELVPTVKFGLEVATDKTHTLRFGRNGGPHNGRFDFLGFELYWEPDRQGKPRVKRRTATKKYLAGKQRIR